MKKNIVRAEGIFLFFFRNFSDFGASHKTANVSYNRIDRYLQRGNWKPAFRKDVHTINSQQQQAHREAGANAIKNASSLSNYPGRMWHSTGRLRHYTSRMWHYPCRLWHYPGRLWHYPGRLWQYPSRLWHYPSRLWHYPSRLWHYSSRMWHYSSRMWHYPGRLWHSPGFFLQKIRILCLVSRLFQHIPALFYDYYRRK